VALRAVLAAVQQQELAVQAMVPTVAVVRVAERQQALEMALAVPDAVVRVALGYQQPVVAVLCHMARVADWESV